MADAASVGSGAATGAGAGASAGPWGAALGAVVGGGLAWMNSEQARSASAGERAKMQQLIDQLKDPQFDPNQLSPEQYAVAAKYVPQMASFIEEAKPTIIQETQSMVQGKNAQRDALERLSGISKSTDVDPQMQALANAASRKAQTEAQVRQASILQDAERRGGANNGVTLAAQLAASENGMDRLANTQNQNAGNAYQERLQALAQSGQLGGQMRQEDAALQGKNADIINAFNARNTRARQDYENSQANMLNDANRLNTGALNSTNNANTDIRNNAAKNNLSRADQIAQAQYNAQANKVNMGIGMGAQQINALHQNAQDKNNAIQGIVNVGTAYAGSQSAQDAENARQDRLDRREQYKKTGQWGTQQSPENDEEDYG